MSSMTGPCLHPSNARSPLFQATDYVSAELFDLERCNACGLVLTRPLPADPARYYPQSYHAQANGRRLPVWVEVLQGALYRRRAARVAQLATGGRPGRVLDIGCGPGLLLDAFRRHGWEACGTELHETAARGPRERFGLHIETANITQLPWPDAYFDAVVLWHVLEHLADPEPALIEAARVLRPGGICLIAVPNFASWEAGWARDSWFHLDVPRHLVHFTPQTLEAALDRAALEICHRAFGALEYDTFSLVQSALNRLGLPHNRLYDVLRGRRASLGRIPAGSAWQSALSLGLALPLATAALPLGALCASLGRGATFTVTARRCPDTDRAADGK
jgi:SAM-dependent methyltransferase